MQNLLNQIGYYCQKGYKISVLQSAAGYYIGTADEDGPNCRLSNYGKSPDDPALNEERECMENQWCNGNSLSGCKVSVSECRKHGIAVKIGE